MTQQQFLSTWARNASNEQHGVMVDVQQFEFKLDEDHWGKVPCGKRS